MPAATPIFLPSSVVHPRFFRPRAIPELFDLRLLAKRTTGSETVPVSVHYQVLLTRNAL